VVQELALVLRQARLVAAVERAPDAAVRALKSFMIWTVHNRN
jgi:hypothetical protein